MECLQRQPGLSFRQVAKKTGIPSGTVRHHLNVLLRDGRIWETRLGCRLAHFPGRRPVTTRARREAIAATFDRVDGCIYLAVRDEGPMAQKDILGRFTEEPHSTVQHRVKRLVRFGILQERIQGRYRMYSIGELGS